MLKLYKQDVAPTLYWEAWASDDATVVVHHGKLGTRGTNRNKKIPRGVLPDDFIEQLSEPARAEGYREIPFEEQTSLILQFKTQDPWGAGDDLDKRYAVEELLNELLGWTGNGMCDGGDIGSGTMNLFSYVVDPQLACQAIVAELKKEGIEGGIIAVETEDDYQVLWPEDFEGEFSPI
ncbi:hypothetical protein [Blastopirellula marina]|uniref:WGR domain-containing protein n=1 Tax=Blastopirellula marina TaxID=124 RepID=A0A2S8GLY7_9BACT|nr:hypothetical protein [Blastopirellula marina]PQO45024.1 hypothetical protein C5Y93_15945 [Blastopirellula marina]